jgi:hypothetical protein
MSRMRNHFCGISLVKIRLNIRRAVRIATICMTALIGFVLVMFHLESREPIEYQAHQVFPIAITSKSQLDLEFFNGHFTVSYYRPNRSSYTTSRHEFQVPLIGAFGYDSTAFKGNTLRRTSITCPIWILEVVTFGLLAFIIFRPRFVKRLRGKRSQCLSCGYNLTGNTSGTCSECGTKTVGQFQ